MSHRGHFDDQRLDIDAVRQQHAFADFEAQTAGFVTLFLRCKRAERQGIDWSVVSFVCNVSDSAWKALLMPAIPQYLGVLPSHPSQG